MSLRYLLSGLTLSVVAVSLWGCAQETDGTTDEPAASATPSAETTESDPWAEHKHGLTFVHGYEQGIEQVKASGKPGMFFVTTTWCGPCKKLASENFTDRQVRELLDEFVLVIVDGDTDNAGLEAFETEGFPHIVFLSSDLEKVGEVLGYTPPAEFTPVVQQALQRSAG